MSRRPRGRLAASSLLGAAAVLALVATAASGAQRGPRPAVEVETLRPRIDAAMAAFGGIRR